MKKIIFLLIAINMLIVNCTSYKDIFDEEINRQIVGACHKTNKISTNGLIAYYPFNGNKNDESINTFDGTCTNCPSLTTSRFGKSNTAYFFDGVNDMIFFPDIQNTTSDTTISIWIKPNFIPVSPTVASFLSLKGQNGTGGDFYNMSLLDAKLKILQYKTPSVFEIYEYNTINLNNWYHIVIVLRKSSVADYYIDNTKVNTTTINGINDWFSIQVGAKNSLTPYTGKIDDIRIYNRSLSKAEITLLYQENDCT